MYKIVFAFIFCSIVLFAKESLSISSVEFSDKKSKQTSNYLEKVFSGEIGVSYSTNDTSNRVAYFGTLRYEDLFYNFIKAKLEYRYTNLNIKKELSLRVDTPGLPNTKTVEKSFTTSGFREAYLDFDLGRYVSFSIGRQVIVWGQFEILSPIDMLLPYEYSTGISSISKVQNRLPQNSAILNIFPSSNFKITGYYFPKIERDEMVQEIFDAGEVYYDINQKKIEQPDKDEEYRIAMRATYFADNFTFGITYYDGWENFFTEYEYLEPSSRNRLHDDLTIVDYPMVSKVIATGIELSVPINKWTWKLEATQTKSTKGFDRSQHSEHELEIGLVYKIREFLGQMGTDFSFMANQYKLEVADEEYFIDLLLYHRRLKSLIAIELKIGKFRPEYTGKMNFYLSVLNDTINIGIIICKDKKRTIVEYALKDSTQPIGVATYKLTETLPKDFENILPSPQQISERLQILLDDK